MADIKIRIPFYKSKDAEDMIYQCIKSLGGILKLENINWNKALEFSLVKTLVLDVCDYYNNQTKSTIELSKIFGINISTIQRYLKIGHKLGWCCYDNRIGAKGIVVKIINGEDIYIYIAFFKRNHSFINRKIQY